MAILGLEDHLKMGIYYRQPDQTFEVDLKIEKEMKEAIKTDNIVIPG